MLPALCIKLKKNAARFLFIRKLPFESSKPLNCVVAGAFTRSFSRAISFQPRDTPTSYVKPENKKRFIAHISPKCLNDDVKLFLDELERYEKGSAAGISKKQLEKLIKNNLDDPDMCRMLLKNSLDFELKHPECRGLVDSYCFHKVIQSCVLRDQVEQADELLTLCQSTEHIQPQTSCFSMVMNGYAKRKTPDALERIKVIVSALEKERLEDKAPTTTPLNCYIYTILMNAYIGVLGKQSLTPVRQTIERMSDIAERSRQDAMRPDLPCYTTLMKAFILQRKSGFASEVNTVLTQLKADKYYSEQPAKDRLHLESVAIDAWSKSDDPHAPKRARQIFDAMEEPDVVAYNSLCNTYSAVGDVDEVFLLYQKMEADYDTGKNKDCLPNMQTYVIILNALQKSNRKDAVEKAEQIFNAIPSPNSVTYNTLLNIYAQSGDVEKALNLLQRKQSDYDTGENKKCCPNTNTYATVLNALQKSNRPDAVEKAEQIFNAIPSPNTITFCTLLNIYAQRGDVEKALSLVNQMQSDYDSGKNKKCRPTLQTYNIILNALQKSNLSDAVMKAEHIFNAIPLPNTITYCTLLNMYAQRGDVEKALSLVNQMQSDYDAGKNKDCRPNMHTYNTILNALQKSNRTDATEKAEQIFNALPLPNAITYDTLLNMYAQKGDVVKALSLVKQMQSNYESGKNKECCPNMHTYNTILNALQKSNRKDAVEKAEQIFNAIPLPNTITCNTLLKMYARTGDVEKALTLLQRMQSDHDSEKNKDCCPNIHTYNTILNVLQKSNLSDVAETAEQIFNALPSPNTVTYNILINIYAERGKGKDAVSLACRMQSDYESGKNRNCLPSDVTKKSVLKALRISNDRALKNDARDILEWFRERKI
jgi:pentatricopeptide repeat protein